MEDIAPQLLETLRARFSEKIAVNPKIRAFAKKIKAGDATYVDAEDYAYLIGNALSEVFMDNLSSAVLPDGRMYYNIAQRVLQPLLEEDHAIVSDAAAMVQTFLNQKANIGIKAQTVPVDEDRIYGIVNKVADAESFDDVKWVLDAPVVNFSMNVVDETLRANVDFQGRSGLTPKVIRKSERKCCKWCSDLVGVYDYPVDREVYQRHERCRCTVEYDPGDGRRQNVYTKRWTDAADSDTLEMRRSVGLNSETERPVRSMANGPRRGRLTVVSEAEQRQLLQYADDLKIPRGVLSFNTGYNTSYDDELNVIHIRGDVFPSKFAENPESILSAKAALAHEYYGHYLHHSQFKANDWRDEFQASYRAAIDAPGLSQTDRILLMIDAFERPKASGVTVKLNAVARRVIYGHD